MCLLLDDHKTQHTTSSIRKTSKRSSAVSSASESIGKSPAKPAVRKTAKSVGRDTCDDAQKKAGENFRGVRMTGIRHERHAAAVRDFKPRVGLCKMAMIDRAAGVDVYVNEYQDKQTNELRKRGSREGLQTCESVWHCPC